MNEHPQIAFWLFVAWPLIFLGGPWFLRYVAGHQRRKRLFSMMQIGGWSLFVLFCLVATGDPWVLIKVVPIAAFIVWVTFRMSTICETCGDVVNNSSWYYKMVYCSKCGTKLNR
jgi:hypothetical protein